jgi:hypothetical protein
MKRITSILLIFTIMISMTTVVFADWPTNYGTQPPADSAYPYRYLFSGYDISDDNLPPDMQYWVSSKPLFLMQFDNGPSSYKWYLFSGDTGTLIKRYDMRFTGTSIVYDYLGTDMSFKRKLFWPTDIKYANTDVNALDWMVSAPHPSKLFFKNSDAVTVPTNNTVTFVLPNNNFADNTSTMVFLTKYTMPVPINADKNKMKIEITGGVAGSGETLSHDFKTVEGKWEGLLKFTRQLYPGNNAITFTLKYDGAIVGSATVNVKYYDDFIDTDGDGIDDRTGQTEVPDDWELPVEDNTPDGSILGYIKWAFENITYIFDGVVGLVEGLFKMTGKMSNIIGEYMGGLPKPIDTVLVIGCLVVIILKIFGR